MNEETLRDWGKRLKDRRGSISQEKLGLLAGLDQSTISRIEHARLESISDEVKWKLARALRCPVGELFPYPNVTPPLEQAA